jgi:hypothetical protein
MTSLSADDLQSRTLPFCETRTDNSSPRLPPDASGAFVKTALLILCIGFGAYQAFGAWKEKRAEQALTTFLASEPKDRPASKSGFIEAMLPDGVDPYVVTVFMPTCCPLAAGQRGRALVEKIKSAGIPVTASSDCHMTLKGSSRSEIEAKIALSNKQMMGETPIVFYKGRVKNNPSFEEVQLEYQTSK